MEAAIHLLEHKCPSILVLFLVRTLSCAITHMYDMALIQFYSGYGIDVFFIALCGDSEFTNMNKDFCIDTFKVYYITLQLCCILYIGYHIAAVLERHQQLKKFHEEKGTQYMENRYGIKIVIGLMILSHVIHYDTTLYNLLTSKVSLDITQFPLLKLPNEILVKALGNHDMYIVLSTLWYIVACIVSILYM